MKILERIISFDGVGGVGISTQISLLRLKLQESGYKVMLFRHSNIADTVQDLILIKDLLSLYSDLIVIWDCTFFKDMVTDLTIGYTDSGVIEKYRDCLYRYKVLIHDFKSLHFLMLPQSIDICYSNLLKQLHMTGQSFSWDVSKNQTILNLFRMLDSHIISFGISLYGLEVYRDERALDIHSKILKILG